MITVGGIEYELSAVDGVTVYVPVVQADGIIAASIGFAKRLPRSPSRIYQGDSLGPILLAGRDQHDAVIPVGAGWTCRSQVLDAQRQNVVVEREVTDLVSVEGDDWFSAKLTGSESAQLTPTSAMVPTTFWWSVEIENEALDYRRTVEVRLAVLVKP